ncbi:hypothetical protein BH10ACI3_BH10ACI3_14300 [soil metagenome]
MYHTRNASFFSLGQWDTRTENGTSALDTMTYTPKKVSQKCPTFCQMDTE